MVWHVDYLGVNKGSYFMHLQGLAEEVVLTSAEC